MNELIQTLQDALEKHLQQNDLEVIGLIPIPTHRDKMIRMQTLQELIENFDESNTEKSTFEYVLKIKPKSKLISQTKIEAPSEKPPTESVYLPNGKLNNTYLIKNGDLLFEAGEFALARNIYKAILSSGEYAGAAHHRLGRCFEAEGKLDEAQTNYENSITYLPTIETYQRLSTLLIKLNKDLQAAETMERALHLKDLPISTKFELHKACGNCWTRAQKPAEAERNFMKALEINPSADEIRANLGALYLQQNKIGDARRSFTDALASNPRNYQALAGIGSCLLNEGEKKLAHDYFARSLEIELNNPNAIYYLVKCAYEIKSYAIASKFLQEYIQIAPINSNLLYSLAGLQFHLGRMSEAKITTLKVLELQPHHSAAKELMNMIERYTSSSK